MAIILFYDIYDIDGLMLLYSLEAKLKRIMLNGYLPKQAFKQTLAKSRDRQTATCLNLRKSRLSEGWKSDTREIKALDKEMSNDSIDLCIIKRAFLASARKAL